MEDAERDLYARFEADFKDLCRRTERVDVGFSMMDAWIVLGQLQLALRHPDNVGPAAAIARGIAKRLESAVALTPALAEVARRGWSMDEGGPDATGQEGGGEAPAQGNGQPARP